MPVFNKDAGIVKSIATQDFELWNDIEVSRPKRQTGQDDTVDDAKKVQALTKKFLQVANGENSGICLAALEELRCAVSPLAEEDMLLGQNMDTQRRLSNLLGEVGGPWKFETGPIQNNCANTLLESSPEMLPRIDAELDPKEQAKILSTEIRGKRMEQFTVRVNKEPGTKLGITTCWADGQHLIVSGIISGLVQNYNAKQSPAAQVEVGDRIVSIDGQSAPLHILTDRMVKATGEFSFEVRTHTKFTVNVTRGNGDKLGLDVSNKPYDQSLLIKDIYPGVVKRWSVREQNRKWPSLSDKIQRVAKGDRIVAINGSNGPGHLLRKMVNEARGEISLTMVRSIDRQVKEDRPTEGWRGC